MLTANETTTSCPLVARPSEASLPKTTDGDEEAEEEGYRDDEGEEKAESRIDGQREFFRSTYSAMQPCRAA
jgi:hypothetical protein